MWRRLVLLLVLFVAASSATKGERRTRKSVRRHAQVGPEKSDGVAPPPLSKAAEDEKIAKEKKEKEDKEKKEKEEKEKKCKVKEPKLPKESKAPSFTPPPPPALKDDAQVGVQANEDPESDTTEGGDAVMVGEDPLSSDPLPTIANATIDDDLPYCTDAENSEGLAGDLSTTRGASIGKAPIAASALGLVTILLGFIGYKYYRDRRAVNNDGDKIAIANLY